MSKKWISFLVAAVVGAVILAPSTAFATCVVKSIGTLTPVDNVNTSNVIPGTYGGSAGTQLTINNDVTATGLTLNAEGQAERAADILIYDDGLVATDVCFANTQVFTIAYNAPLPSNVSLSEFSTGNFFHFDVMDSAQPNGLRVTTSASQVVAGFNTVVTNININVTNAGTAGNLTTGAAGAAVRVKNVRFDATLVSGATGTIDANVSWSGVAGSSVAGAATVRVGTKAATIGAVTSPTCTSVAAGDCASGPQSSNGTLTTNLGNQNFSFAEGFSQAFRTAGTTGLPYSAVFNDIATNSTDVIFNVTNLPSGVTVTFPGTLSTSASAEAANSISMTTTNTSAISGSGAVVYNTTHNGSATSTLALVTGASAGAPTATTAGQIGINIAAPSGFTTTPVFIDGYFGPGSTAAFTGDPDVNSSAIPRYATATARRFLHHNWFTVGPVRTILLFPVMQSLGTFTSGLEVSNTGLDTVTTCTTGTGAVPGDIFGATCTAAQTGSVTFFVFGQNVSTGTAVVFSVATTATGFPGRGLTAAGLLVPGTTVATSIDGLLTAGGQSAAIGHFEGYAIAVTQFNYGHGTGVLFNTTSGAYTAYQAHVMGTGRGTTPESLQE